MKPIDVKDNIYINIGKEVNDKDLKFKVGDHVRIIKYKNVFIKGYFPNWSVYQYISILVISKIKNTVPWIYNIKNLTGEEIVGIF